MGVKGTDAEGELLSQTCSLTSNRKGRVDEARPAMGSWAALMQPRPGQEYNTTQGRAEVGDPSWDPGILLPLGRLSFHNTAQRLVRQTMEASGSLQRTGCGTSGTSVPL